MLVSLRFVVEPSARVSFAICDVSQFVCSLACRVFSRIVRCWVSLKSV